MTSKPEEVRECIKNEFKRGITEIDVIGGYDEKKHHMLMCAIYTKDYLKLKKRITEIDDKSFFGYKCMALRNNYLQLDTWQFNTANDLYSISFVNSEYNVNDKATKSIKIEINLSSIIQNHFINNKAFYENWNKFDNYINILQYEF